MKKLLLLLLFPVVSYCQELTLNPDTKIYEYSHVKEFSIQSSELLSKFENKMLELNYTNISKTDTKIIGSNFISFLVLSTTIQANYQVIIELKDNKYRLLINRFVADDKRYSPIPIEDLKSHTKKWVQKINEKLPTIVNALESAESKW